MSPKRERLIEGLRREVTCAEGVNAEISGERHAALAGALEKIHSLLVDLQLDLAEPPAQRYQRYRKKEKA